MDKSQAGIGFCSGAHDDQPIEEEAAAIIEEDAEDMSNFVIPGGVCHNWVAVDVPTVIHRSKGFLMRLPEHLSNEKQIIQLRLKNPATVKLGHYKCNVKKKKREKRVKNQIPS
ncbi:hypothetical protein KIW84_012527 [Lathyrus oleraceus]|uniref:Uncharacterized protein n=1 Tax=Pisum sativum TaxID=3888 RepID=A0A9D5BI29_PEA|nr:hypothetical protein KIW84_012527 [Pisum sativum]